MDAILGASKLMHTVIEAECTGCDLCLPPCPVDCISIVPVKQDIDTWQWPAPAGPASEEPDATLANVNPQFVGERG